MAIELIDLGTVTQDGADGDLAREAFIKVNANFTELDLATVTQAEAEAGVSTTKRAWTAQRVAQAVRGGILTGLSLAVGGAITATDTVISSLGKLQKQITDAATNLASNVRNTALTGYVVGTNTVLAATDTILTAFGKAQAQINSLGSSKLDVGATAVAASTLTGLTASVGELNYTDGVTSNIQTQLNTKAPLASPPLTGVPTAPTAAVNTNTTQLATTAFVNAEIANDAPTKTGGGASGTWGVSVTGNAATATKLATGRTLATTGDVTWTSPAFDGSANVTAAATLANSGVTAGTYPKVTVDAKGRVTTGSALVAADIPALDASKITTGTLNSARLDATLTALAGVTTAADKLIYATGADTFATATLTSLARNLLDDTTQLEMQSTLGLVKQTNVDDLTPGRMVLTESVRRRVSGGVSAAHRDRLILLHPLYQSTYLPYSSVDGKFTATRGSADASLNQTIAEVVSSSAYNTHVTSLYDLGGNPAGPWQVVSCTYQDVKYAALIVPYHVSGYSKGIFFEGRAVSDDANQLLCIEYYARDTSTVLNSEVYDSIAPLSVQKTLLVGGETVYRTGNILGTVSQSSGVPTGAIIERGSNANGNYVRYADGTQICTAAWTMDSATSFGTGTATDPYRTSVKTINWAAAFSIAPVASAIPTRTGTGLARIGYVSGESISTTQLVNFQVIAVTNDVAPTVYIQAIGRWF